MADLTADSRTALAADLARAGFVRGSFVFAGGRESSTYFDKYLVLTRPGLLSRCADMLAPLVDDDADRLAARGSGALLLAAALAERRGVPLLVPKQSVGHGPSYGGELFPGARVTLVEDVLLTGHRAVQGLTELRDAGVEVAALLCLLDREQGARFRIEAEGVPVHSLFVERELVS
jgi:orotate phosphoribosyltransferase